MYKLIVFVLYLMSFQSLAGFQLISELSDVSFTSIKSGSIAENHFFKQISGGINPQGKLDLEFDVASLETHIPIRNERMNQFLFESKVFPLIKVTANIKKQLGNIQEGIQSIKSVPITLDLHGHQHTLELDLMVVKQNAQLIVYPKRAVNINAIDFALTSGIETLRKMAGLNHIVTTVPVYFNLVFYAVDQ